MSAESRRLYVFRNQMVPNWPYFGLEGTMSNAEPLGDLKVTQKLHQELSDIGLELKHLTPGQVVKGEVFDLVKRAYDILRSAEPEVTRLVSLAVLLYTTGDPAPRVGFWLSGERLLGLERWCKDQ